MNMRQLISMFCGGKQLSQKQPSGLGYYVRPITNGDIYRETVMSFKAFYVRACAAKKPKAKSA